MFEQLKENIELAGDSCTQASAQIKASLEALKRAPRFKKAAWLSVIGAIVVGTSASCFSLVWYKTAALILILVVVPLGAWLRKGR